jgi:hypothetical protein
MQQAKTKLAALLTCLLAGGLTTAPAYAQWVVTDPAMQTEVATNQVTQIGHMVQQYSQMITQYQSLLSSLQSLDLNFMPINNKLTPIDNPSQIVQQNCPGASISTTVMSVIGISPSLTEGEIVGQQRTICANIVMLQVDKYNTVANMLNRMNVYSNAVQQLSDKVNQIGQTASNAASAVTGSVGSSGDRQGVQNQADQIRNGLATEMAQVQQHLQAVDATISSLKDQQSMLANIALKGSNATGPAALAGQIIQAGAFAAAFPQ